MLDFSINIKNKCDTDDYYVKSSVKKYTHAYLILRQYFILATTHTLLTIYLITHVYN